MLVKYQIGGYEEKTLSQPWFDLVKKGKKKYEGRLNKGFFGKLKVGDKFTFVNNGKKINVEVIKILNFDNFEEAYKDLGNELLPTLMGKSVCEIYNKCYDSKDIKKHGVLAIRIKVIT
jgi:ASC-1-like (ASCH) protein